MLDFLAPRSCAFCGVFSTADERGLCVNCFDDLPWRVPAASPTPGIFECSMAMMDYEFPVDVAIKALKFKRRLYYAPALAEVLCTARRSLPADIDSVLPVPLHWRRKMVRGFNQATELAVPVARSFGIEILRGVKRCKATPSQSGLGATERRRNLRQAFSARHRVFSKHVLIIDDVITTGATLTELGKVLLSNGAQKVSALTVASAR
ncbi:MAG TPA: ComF family protein [Woeseiaceae bacterium]|nr:ComF family protein [Woeseiaceae bacterium]